MRIADKFDTFNAENPKVYEVLVRLARDWVAFTGRRKLGIASLFERARWEIAILTKDAEYKLNNDFRAFYARMIMLREPDLAGLFELRQSEADIWMESLCG